MEKIQRFTRNKFSKVFIQMSGTYKSYVIQVHRKMFKQSDKIICSIWRHRNKIWHKVWLIKKKKRLPTWYLILPHFKIPTFFWNFDHPIVNYEQIRPTTPTQYPHHWTGTLIRLEKRHTWSKFIISANPVFSWSESMCHVEENLLI